MEKGMRFFGKILLWLGAISLVLGMIGAFSPWTNDAYVSIFPNERTAYANDPAGGPYPEMGFLMLAIVGFFIVMAGFAFRFGTKGQVVKMGVEK
jgi:hypothetical protein